MANQNTTAIVTDAQQIINAVNALLPAVEALVPAAKDNAQLINVSVTAAEALLPLINLIPSGGKITKEQQAAQYARVYAIISGNVLSGPEWQKQS